MNSTRPDRRSAASSSAVAVFALVFAAAPAAAQIRPGAAAPDFTLPNAATGQPVALKDLLTKNKAVAVMFIATKCPYSNGYNGRMAAMARDYAGKGVAFVGINSNKSEGAAEVAEHARKNGFGFPVLKDDLNKIADAYNATKTPEIFVVDPKGTVLYSGRIDETHDEPEKVTSPDLKNALDAILSGKPVARAETKAFGCTIKRV